MKRVLDFLKLLRDNNSKEWFDEHRWEWKEVQQVFNTFTEELIEGIASFDPSVRGVNVRECTYRINRDTRFSRDKTPYKTHMGAYIAPKGKKSGYAGYYFHVEPEGNGFTGDSQLAAGLYMPEAVILRSVRDEIFDNGAQMEEAISMADGFTLNQDYKLKRTPKGFPLESEFDEMLKLKFFFMEKPIDNAFLLSDNLLERSLSHFETTMPFLSILNRAVQFGYEEMM